MDFDDFSPLTPAPEARQESPQQQPEAEPLPWPPPQPSRPLQAPQRAAQLARHAPVQPFAARAKAGLGMLAAAAGAGAGGVLAGPMGAAAGLVGVGALRNLYRSQGVASADPTERGDAARSLVLGAIGVAIVGYLGYKIYSSSKDQD